MTRPRAIMWLIEPDDKDTYTLSKRNRLVLDEVPLRQAMRYVRSHRQDGDPVHRVFEGGRVDEITRHFKDKAPQVANPRRIRFGFTPFRH